MTYNFVTVLNLWAKFHKWLQTQWKSLILVQQKYKVSKIHIVEKSVINRMDHDMDYTGVQHHAVSSISLRTCLPKKLMGYVHAYSFKANTLLRA